MIGENLGFFGVMVCFVFLEILKLFEIFDEIYIGIWLYGLGFVFDEFLREVFILFI